MAHIFTKTDTHTDLNNKIVQFLGKTIIYVSYIFKKKERKKEKTTTTKQSIPLINNKLFLADWVWWKSITTHRY